MYTYIKTTTSAAVRNDYHEIMFYCHLSSTALICLLDWYTYVTIFYDFVYKSKENDISIRTLWRVYDCSIMLRMFAWFDRHTGIFFGHAVA